MGSIARTRAAAMLLGEAGVEKDAVATAIHQLSPRRNAPFLKMSCAAQSEFSLASELFGHERDAFPGAISPRMGLLEYAQGGTLFLDEIGEITPAIQVKLLHALRDGEFRRVGGINKMNADIRLICATSRDLQPAVDPRLFNPDLFYRLSVLPIFIPPLRERKEDIPLLANEFLRRFNEEQGSRLAFTQTALDFLSKFPFPGNVSQLENFVFRAATFATGDEIGEEDFHGVSDSLWATAFPSAAPGAPSPSASIELWSGATASQSSTSAPRLDVADSAPEETDERSDREKLIDAMVEAGWVQARAGRLLGLTPRQIRYALLKHNIPLRKF
ncbi:sigma 54-interacting transcriptional regulator (plasmid) [Methylocystis parvus OBBP]|uniref:sigma 54-interacting transcriptional regulator n=1 Tax=Methylocystis parvus TaxID=134 RepID=UPI0022DCF616|nr:sigma 54-interacting transcriptional regulator [Methylocystis parvus]WBK02370.1 sigma 54-interacting transcriptional regulator [Methylocystis parvus OBBP]